MNKPAIELIAFDADDTLWVNEPIYTEAQQACETILRPYLGQEVLHDRLYEFERKNLQIFGYGVKGFVLSMIETAIELSQGRVKGEEIQRIIDIGKEMLARPIEVLEGVRESLEALSKQYELMIITKGDLFDQESKIARSGLGDFFSKVEIVSEKTPQTYQEIVRRHHIDLRRFLMVGNSLKSDVLPLCEIGAHAVHIPFHTTWVHEQVAPQQLDGKQYWELNDIRELPGFLDVSLADTV
ncbi:MAG: HAD family hydrolase [Bacteroidetes bacterium]|nr:MAG: HAD family hydrolase [Bacteroidota bacterium]